MVDGLNNLHHRCLPKMGFGGMSSHRAIGGDARPLEVAYEHGARMLDFMDPVPFMKDDNPVDKYGDELRGKDLSGFVLTSMPNLFVKDEADIKPGFVRASFEKCIEALNLQETVGAGQPVIDNYKLVMPFAIKLPTKSPAGCVSDMWREMEDLVLEGKVRTLGISNFTQAQVSTLLEHCRIRPATVIQERHPLNQIPEYVRFCDQNKMALFAAVPLAKGDALSSKVMVHPEMTPAQACLHWNMSQNVAVVPGVESLEHIKENCATFSKLALKPIDAPQPEVKLVKVYPLWENGAGGHLLKEGTQSDAGIFRVEEGGKLYTDTDPSREKHRRRSIDELEPNQKKLLADVGKAVSLLGPCMTPHEKRKAIDEYLLSLQEEPTSPTNLKSQHKQHEMRAAEGRNLTGMMVVPFGAFVANGAIPRRSAKTPDQNLHVPVTQLREEDKVVFFSQRWLTPVAKDGQLPSPDDAELNKFKQIAASAKAWSEQNGVKEENLYVWVDFCCIEQDDFEELIRGVNSLALYVCSVDAFVTIEHEVYFDRGWCLMECTFGDASKVPRFIYRHIDKAEPALVPMNIDDRLGLKKPCEGTFTVESDREVMQLLQLLGVVITGKLERGDMMEELDGSHKHA